MSNSHHQHDTDNHQLTRIERVLDYIHTHIDQPLSVELLAEKSCWSRWQLQRVFLSETNQTVAHYVRELKLSLAAEQLLTSKERIVDIALNCGFNSEVSFTRAFKQLFTCSPSAYRKRGQRIGLKTPLQATMPVHEAHEIKKRLLQIRVERRSDFYLHGASGEIQGLYANEPNYTDVVPSIWQQLNQLTGKKAPFDVPAYGVIDTHDIDEGKPAPYWAGFEVTEQAAANLNPAHILHVPAQEYAVIPYTGAITNLDRTLEWFLSAWLPQSNYRGIEGFELEIYQPTFDINSEEATMEYWIPIQPAGK
ncbi:AraC family transcriptional regulator [Photobacterium sanctipauli]|uniref:AraC family transcriptional regulator n=1 Tax=Photobacterium sanctipauli TaxID=1342794 RepID=A0A2T3NUD9_9GAMM|nr:helix-turn-helix domain-containing protein [Photobacterium sanctipauli]PSW19848.1 AraC family transcriptional regulator [Photobacterium sanctipauli]